MALITDDYRYEINSQLTMGIIYGFGKMNYFEIRDKNFLYNILLNTTLATGLVWA